MDQIIILDGNIVGLVRDSGAARWEFERLEYAIELYKYLVLSCEIENIIDSLVRNSL